MIESYHLEFRLAGEPATVTRDELKADDCYRAGPTPQSRLTGPRM